MLIDHTAAAARLATTRQAEGVRWLVDNAAAYDALVEAIAAARHSVWITQLALDADCIVHVATEDGVTSAGAGAPLVDALVAASSDRGVDVRILLNASLLVDTAKPLRRFLRGRRAAGIDVRGFARFPQLLHAKVAIVDGREAFLLGSPFVNGYWDDTRHRPVDARRPLRELAGRPLHDVSFAVTGPVVAELRTTFAELWNDVSIGDGALRRVTTARTGTPGARSTAMRLVRTAPRGVLPAHPDGLAEILPAILAGLAGARSLVYIEHQYLSARPVVDALAAALAREPELEVVVVLNQNPDITAYRGWQNARLREAGLLDHPRVGLFSLWTSADAASPPQRDVNQVFVHSKVLVIDDKWMTVGSANLDGVSLHSYGDDFESVLGQRVFRHVRNFDVNVVIDAGDDALAGAARELRATLWAEHLGQPAVELLERPDGGWIAHWRARAARNVAALAARDGVPAFAGFVLPYSTRSTPRDQLADIGVDAGVLRLRFNPGWLEVHCSPNWVRNMFT